MRELYVMRHAKSSWEDPNLSDFERPLNKRGIKSAKIISEFFVKKKYSFDYVLLSSSKRTKKTLNLILKKINKPKKIKSSSKLYLVNENEIIANIKNIHKKFKKVLIINHEPALKNLVIKLTKNKDNSNFKLLNYKFPTCAFAKIVFDTNDWINIEEKGIISEFVRPKDLVI